MRPTVLLVAAAACLRGVGSASSTRGACAPARSTPARRASAAAPALAVLIIVAAAPLARSAQVPDRAGQSALPDWSGVWRPVEGPVFDGTGTADHPPYTAAFAARYQARLRKPEPDPLAGCVPAGLPRMMTLPGLYEFAVTPEMVLVVADTAPGKTSTGAQVRRIYTDGRPQLAGDDLFPTYTGNSIGRWEGETLVVRTVGLRDDNLIDRTGAQLSGDEVITERIRLTADGVLEDRFTIVDPKALTRPWTVTRRWRRAPRETEIVDDSCGGKRADPSAITDAAHARGDGR